MLRGRSFVTILAFCCCASTAFAQSHGTHEHRFSGAEKWAQIFDDPARDEWQKPAEVIRALGLPPDAVVADIGAGTGYFAVRLARAVPQGHVHGVDVEPDMVRYLSERAKREGLANLTARMGKNTGPDLPAPVDLALLVNTYHHVPDRERYFRDLRDDLKPGGRLAIIDFNQRSPVGPPRAARVTQEQVRSELERAGYELAADHKFLPHQYFLVFQPVSR